jgi:hypothetical protein
MIKPHGKMSVRTHPEGWQTETKSAGAPHVNSFCLFPWPSHQWRKSVSNSIHTSCSPTRREFAIKLIALLCVCCTAATPVSSTSTNPDGDFEAFSLILWVKFFYPRHEKCLFLFSLSDEDFASNFVAITPPPPQLIFFGEKPCFIKCLMSAESVFTPGEAT